MEFQNFVEKLNFLLKSRDKNAADVAIDMKKSQATLYRYIRGTRTPDLEVVVDIAKYFNVSIDWLLGTDTNEEEKRTVEAEIDSAIAEAKKILPLYAAASEEDKSVINSILSKYKR